MRGSAWCTVPCNLLVASSRVISIRLVVVARLFLHLVAGRWTARRKEWRRGSAMNQFNRKQCDIRIIS